MSSARQHGPARLLAATFVLVVAGVALLIRRPGRATVTLGCALVAAGWASNLLDRCGLHRWSAPGSVRGVVDFIPSGGVRRCNIADLWIVVGLVLLGAALLRHRVREHWRDVSRG